MKICPHCRLSDLDDQATVCPHCTRSLPRPGSGKNTVPALILAGLLVVGVYLGWAFWLHPRQERQRARALMDSAYQLCIPQTAEDPSTQALIEQTRSAIRWLDLDHIDKEEIDAAFESGLDSRGCGYNSRNRLPPAHKRR